MNFNLFKTTVEKEIKKQKRDNIDVRGEVYTPIGLSYDLVIPFLKKIEITEKNNLRRTLCRKRKFIGPDNRLSIIIRISD